MMHRMIIRGGGFLSTRSWLFAYSNRLYEDMFDRSVSSRVGL